MSPAPDLGVYIHWPYCARICPYCDFNVVRDRGKTREQTDLAAAILADLEAQASLTGPRRLVSIFFGGGTPSLMDPQAVADMIAAARRLWNAAPDLEISLEANPTDAETGRFAALAKFRLSSAAPPIGGGDGYAGTGDGVAGRPDAIFRATFRARSIRWSAGLFGTVSVSRT